MSAGAFFLSARRSPRRGRLHFRAAIAVESRDEQIQFPNRDDYVPAMSDRAHLDTFLTAVAASPTALERPVCRGWAGDYQITGKHGHDLADSAGFLLYVGTAADGPTPK
jgi:hypothetical protein